MGPQLGSNLLNLGIESAARAALEELGQDLDEVLACEEEPGLGNGGLGRLAACYLDSLATLEPPAIGYGIRYEFGIFDQEIHDGWQVEKTDNWLVNGNPWEIAKPDVNYRVNWGARLADYVSSTASELAAARSPVVTPKCSARWWTTCATTTRSSSSRTTRPTSNARTT
jgi:starch phosphorylase